MTKTTANAPSAPKRFANPQWRRWGFLRIHLPLLTSVAVLAGSILPASAQPRQQPNGFSWGELAMLPAYCKDANSIVYGDKYYNTSPNAPRWESVMGQDFWHVHHYCYALNNLRKANFTANPTEKKFLLQKVRNDLRYMINNCQPEMVLMPEILTRMGDVQNMLGDVAAAYDAYDTVINRKPDYWPAYKSAADMFLKAGVKARGIDILLRGIAANPGATELRESYKAAGGDMARLPPLPAPGADSARGSSAGSQAGEQSREAPAAAPEPTR